MNKSLKSILIFSIILCIPSITKAHFLWLITKQTDSDHQYVELYFGEIAEPDDPTLLNRVKDVKVVSVSKEGQVKPVVLKLSDQDLKSTPVKFEDDKAICLKHSYGLMTRGDSSFVLNYYGKTYTNNSSDWASFPTAKQNDLDIVPTRKDEEFTFKVLLKGKPLPNAELKIYGDDLDKTIETHTDSNGEYQCKMPLSGVYSIRAKHVENTSGSLDDEKYDSIRHYSTLVLNFEKSSNE